MSRHLLLDEPLHWNTVMMNTRTINGTLTQMSSRPLTTVTSMGGWCSALEPWCSMTARIEFLNNSNSMWYRWEGTYTILMGTPCSSSVHNKIWCVTSALQETSCDLWNMTKNSWLMCRNTFWYLKHKLFMIQPTACAVVSANHSSAIHKHLSLTMLAANVCTILWYADPLLGNGSTNRHKQNNSMATGGYNNNGKWCSLRSLCYRYVMQQQEKWWERFFSVRSVPRLHNK
jgi:hypothetical protein